MLSKHFALVDCNNFYVSCERVFQPSLEKKPVLVLSSNEGCVIARSNESKTLGIGMGVPYYQIKTLVAEYNIKVFSSNFALYGDMSERVMHILSQSDTDIEIYSVDEAFLDLTSLQHEKRLKYAQALVKKIRKWTGLPVSIGCGPTKTLAKAANHYVKKHKVPGGVLDLSDLNTRSLILSKIAVGDIWGIGRKTAEKLQRLGFYTANQLLNLDSKIADKKFNIGITRTLRELQGESLVELDDMTNLRKQIIVSRSFGDKISDFFTIKSALLQHISTAAEKLRAENLLAKTIQIFLHTNRFQEENYHHSHCDELPLYTDNTVDFIQAGLKALQAIFKDNTAYKKAGVIIMDIIEKEARPIDMFAPLNTARQDSLMETLDDINQNMGRGTLRYASVGKQQAWQPRVSLRSPAYTTQWEDLPIVN